MLNKKTKKLRKCKVGSTVAVVPSLLTNGKNLTYTKHDTTQLLTIFAASYHVKRDRTSTKCLSKQSPLFFQTEKGLLWVNLRSKQHHNHKLLLWSNLKGKISRKDSFLLIKPFQIKGFLSCSWQYCS